MGRNAGGGPIGNAAAPIYIYIKRLQEKDT